MDNELKKMILAKRVARFADPRPTSGALPQEEGFRALLSSALVEAEESCDCETFGSWIESEGACFSLVASRGAHDGDTYPYTAERVQEERASDRTTPDSPDTRRRRARKQALAARVAALPVEEKKFFEEPPPLVSSALVASAAATPNPEAFLEDLGVSLTDFRHLNAQRRDALVAAVGGGETDPKDQAGSAGDRRYMAYLKLWTDDFQELNEQLVREAARLYLEKVTTADAPAPESLTAAARPSNRLTPDRKKRLRTIATNFLFQGEQAKKFDTLIAERTLDAISAALYGSGKHWFSDLISDEFLEHIEAERAEYDLLLEAVYDATNWKLYRQLERHENDLLEELDNIDNDDVEAIKDWQRRRDDNLNRFDKEIFRPRTKPEISAAKYLEVKRNTYYGNELNSAIIEFLEGEGPASDRLLNALGAQIERNNPALLNNYFPNLSRKAMLDINTKTKACYRGMVDRVLEDIDQFLLEGADPNEAELRAIGMRPNTNKIHKDDFKTKRRQRDYERLYGLDSNFSPVLSRMGEDLAAFNANLALEEYAKSEAQRNMDKPVTVRKRWKARMVETRPSHRLANGQTVAPDQSFTVGGYSAAYPLDPELPPKERFNCRCRVEIVAIRDGKEVGLDMGLEPKMSWG